VDPVDYRPWYGRKPTRPDDGAPDEGPDVRGRFTDVAEREIPPHPIPRPGVMAKSLMCRFSFAIDK
jgi:hypothetical protein